jgi:hypothetical protein
VAQDIKGEHGIGTGRRKLELADVGGHERRARRRLTCKPQLLGRDVDREHVVALGQAARDRFAGAAPQLNHAAARSEPLQDLVKEMRADRAVLGPRAVALLDAVIAVRDDTARAASITPSWHIALRLVSRRSPASPVSWSVPNTIRPTLRRG